MNYEKHGGEEEANRMKEKKEQKKRIPGPLFDGPHVLLRPQKIASLALFCSRACVCPLKIVGVIVFVYRNSYIAFGVLTRFARITIARRGKEFFPTHNSPMIFSGSFFRRSQRCCCCAVLACLLIHLANGEMGSLLLFVQLFIGKSSSRQRSRGGESQKRENFRENR